MPQRSPNICRKRKKRTKLDARGHLNSAVCSTSSQSSSSGSNRPLTNRVRSWSSIYTRLHRTSCPVIRCRSSTKTFSTAGKCLLPRQFLVHKMERMWRMNSSYCVPATAPRVCPASTYSSILNTILPPFVLALHNDIRNLLIWFCAGSVGSAVSMAKTFQHAKQHLTTARLSGLTALSTSKTSLTLRSLPWFLNASNPISRRSRNCYWTCSGSVLVKQKSF